MKKATENTYLEEVTRTLLENSIEGMLSKLLKLVIEASIRAKESAKCTKESAKHTKERANHAKEKNTMLKDQLQELKAITAQILDELKAVKEAAPPFPSLSTSYTSVAGASVSVPHTSNPTTSVNLSSSASQNTDLAATSVTLNLTHLKSKEVNVNNTGAVRKRVDQAFSDHLEMEGIKCKGISRDPRDSKKYKIMLSTSTIAQTAH